MCTKLLIVSRYCLITCMLIVCSTINASAQFSQKAVELALTSTISAQTVAVSSEIDRTNALQSATLGENTAITVMLNNILDYERKVYNYLSEAQSIVTSAFAVTKCLRMGTEIIEELNSCRKAAQNHPQGLIVSSLVTSQYSDIISESAALTSYLAPIVKGTGKKNLLNSSERINILNSVQTRLYNILWAVKQMKMNIMQMKWMDLVESLTLEQYNRFHNTGNAYNVALKMLRKAEKKL